MLSRRVNGRVGRGLALAVAAGLIGISAQTAAAQEDEAPAVNSGNVSASLGVDFTTHYFFRGALQEDQGLIVQPYAEIGFQLTDDLSLFAGIWNSFHEEKTFAAGGVEAESWYEADLYIGAGLSITDELEASLSYITYTSPNGGFDTIEEVDFSLSYDDSALWGDSGFALAPSVTVAVETNKTLLGSDEGVWLGLGIEPSFSLLEGDCPVTLSIPVTLGLSLDNYYEDVVSTGAAGSGSGDDDNYGYLDIGVVASMPLPIPEGFGAWDLSAGVHFMFLSDNLEELNNGDDTEIVGTFGISMSY